MKERIQGVVAGVLIGALCTGGAAFAKSKLETIEVEYDNIKVYKDNVLCELKDANGSVIEPFIYNGTTYMPVRGTASLADMDVTWDGNTKSVYLWDNMVASGTYLMDVCPPYELDCTTEYSSSKGNTFKMSGGKYSNGLVLHYGDHSNALFNLNSRFSTLECTVGHVDGDNYANNSVTFLVDGKVVKTVELEAECLPKTVSIPLSYGLQLKIIGGEDWDDIGIGNMTVK